MSTLAGTYRIEVGPVFYIGSTTALGPRLSDHRTRLEKGEHPNETLQWAYNQHRTFAGYLLTEIPRKVDDSDKDHRRRLQFHEQIELDANFFKKGCANTSQNSGFNTTLAERQKERWKNPEHRQRQLALLHAGRQAYQLTPTARRKMADAKRGAKNHNARPCTLHRDGKTFKFATGAEAAQYFGTTQQAMDAWLKGAASWPGTGRKPARKHNRHLIGLTGSYDDLVTCRKFTAQRNNNRKAARRYTVNQSLTNRRAKTG